MSVTFYGRRPDGSAVTLDIENAAYLNMNSANARAFLLFLGLEPGDEPYGETTMPEARRAVMRARATFDRNVGKFTREGSDTKKPGQCRVITGAIDESYFAMRLDAFEKLLAVVSAKGATSIYWA